MQMIDLSTKRIDSEGKWDGQSAIFVLCTPSELVGMQHQFHFDENTLVECMNFDENVRFNNFASYDFISFVYFWKGKKGMEQAELNLYVSEKFLVLVVPETVRCADLRASVDFVCRRAQEAPYDDDLLNRLYYLVFDRVISDFSNAFERMEDELNRLEKRVNSKVDSQSLSELAAIKEDMYRVRRHIRPMLYIGDQMLINENGNIREKNLRFFQNIDMRLNKLQDFVANLQEYTTQVLNAYNSKVAMQTNDVINKLTIVSVIVGPLTVITGIYGMNFTHMPELTWTLGYPVALGTMAIITLGIIWFLKQKKWL